MEIKNLYKNFGIVRGEVKVLRDINFTIHEGEFLLILGPSGSGKSTLLNAILGLELPSAGNIVINGKDITKMTPDERATFRLKNVGIIFQKPDWIKSLSVIENVAFPLAAAESTPQDQFTGAKKHLESVGMLGHADFRPYQLSAGQQELVEFARAMVLDPHMIIADEPTGNLDSDSANKVMEMFQALNEKQGATIIMVTHNIGHVKYASRTIYLKDGKILDGSSAYTAADLEELEATPVI
ncbi:MAG: hypothetical protein A3F54_03855 [Candidatus Kerfeldbacteria bacterium RIFCSPHIGHO2_12_FULL_48_17]|uniref:ABC transporter domain-containing protein n=1 Tax=Candidatus Kerfeldbacteria bacterium RIFCSPHIGHO2_12_FULL_48_17 TaxID=1798542 RepID=A0A1G2B6K1_9BACT|nr:MAG: hypothetical protein A3F54_03855 [Candidatus Kerfeldbacteria bacterium RIFCSPHIGHO2_12_FULL_48_17]